MNEIVSLITENPIAVLTDAAKYSEFYQRIKAEVSAHVPDVSTAKGRSEIKSLAYKVTRTKTAIDDAGKKLNEEARAQINVVDASRRKIRDELDALAEEARKPLTEWEAAEDARQERAAAIHNRLHELSNLSRDDGSNLIADRIAAVEAIEIDPAVFGVMTDDARRDQAKALADLKGAFDRAKQHEADQAELARLRQEAEARERAEAEARERAAAEAEAKERAEREAASKAKAEEDARKRAEQLAAEQKEREERAVEAARQDEQRKAAEAVAKAEAEAKAVRENAEREARERQAAIDREKRDQEAREADRKHRAKVMGEAKAAIMTCGADEETSKKVVLAIVANEVPHVSLRF